MNELKLLAAILAGMRGAGRFENGKLFYTFYVSNGKEPGEADELTGDDIQFVADKLREKKLISVSFATGAIRITGKGQNALREMLVDPAEYFYDDPDYSKQIYAGTAFICRTCGYSDADMDMVQAHIDTDGHDNHNEPEESDEDDYRPGSIYGPPAMDGPRNFDEPITDGGPQKADLSYFNRPITDGGPQSS